LTRADAPGVLPPELEGCGAIAGEAGGFNAVQRVLTIGRRRPVSYLG
jgi:hypothetical protein